MEALAVRNLSFAYAGNQKNTIENICFSLDKGDFLAVCGATGSGKSTLLRMLKKELIQLIKDLCAIPSFSHQEKDKAQFIHDWFKQYQINTIIDEKYNVADVYQNGKWKTVMLKNNKLEVSLYSGDGVIILPYKE